MLMNRETHFRFPHLLNAAMPALFGAGMLLSTSIANATHPSTTTIDFEPPLPAGLVASTDRLLGDFVPPESRVTNFYADQGVLLENIGLLFLEAQLGLPETNFLQTYNSEFILVQDGQFKFEFVSPTDETIPATTEFFSISSDRIGGSGRTFTASAFGLDGNLLGQATQNDTTFPGPGTVLSLHGIGQIHSVIVETEFTIGLDILVFGPLTATPRITIDFEPPLPAGLVASTDRDIGDFVPPESRVTNFYADQGVLFEDIGLLFLEAQLGLPATNFIQGYDANFLIDHDMPLKFKFVSPSDETIPATTEFFSISSDRIGGSGRTFTASAFGLDGNLLGEATQVDTSFPGPGTVVSLHGVGQIHTVVLQGGFTIGFDNLVFGPITNQGTKGIMPWLELLLLDD